MPVELPPTPDVVIEERLAALEDPLLAERLFREHPALYLSEPPQTQRQVLAWATRRFGAVALAVTAAASIVAGYVFAPHATQRPAAPPVAAPAPHRAAPAHHAAAPAHHAAPVTHYVAAPTHVAPAAAAVAPAAVAAPVVTHHHARAHAAAYAPAIAPAVLPHLQPQPQTKKLPALVATHHPAGATRPAPLSQPRSEPAPATDPATATSAATASATSTATTTAVSTVTAGAAPDPARYDAAPMPDGTKTAPVTTGRWTESTAQGGPAAPSPVDPCTPRGGRVGAIMGTLVAPSFRH